MKIWENDNFFIESEPHDLPWIKIFTQAPYKELSDLPPHLYQELWDIYLTCELLMREYFQPDKINMASFGNMLPHLHIHLMARYTNDNHFPNPLWGEQLRDEDLQLTSFEPFYTLLRQKLN